MRNLTEAENKVLALLAEAWNEFQKLPDVLPEGGRGIDKHEFMHAINTAHRIVFARPAIAAQFDDANGQSGSSAPTSI